ncbi:MAG: sigma-54-dependent Fis family transcriptional regulator [Acidobacteria bacterium]|nr:sigma-54-dependent Fis family transcriptional regulator [Acidobacteriota bacterium]
MSLPVPHILIVDDEEIVRESLSGWLEKDGYTVDTAPDGPTALERLRGGAWSILLVDLKMPGMDGLQVLEAARKLQPEAAVVMITAFATVETAVKAIKLGATDYLVKPFDPEELSVMIQRIVNQQSMVRENAILRKALRRDFAFHDIDIASRSAVMQRALDLARSAAHTSSTVLILGESGTGKELLARAIHAESDRRTGPFVAVSCAALTDTLLESELFGHEKGAFTGAASRRRGTFEAAHGGTLFLDEIGDISAKLQLDLLRVLEDRRFCRVGGNDPVAVDVRIISATNRDLRKAVDGGAFREDLYYRVNVIPVTLPPLRERREDIPLLVDILLERLAIELKRPIDGVARDAMALLMSYPFPGNIRELRNILERAIVVASGPTIHAADLNLQVASDAPDGSLESVERQHIARVLEQSHGNVSQAARILDIDRVTLYNKIKKYRLREPAGTA